MQPREIIDTTVIPGGGEMVLTRESGDWVIRVDGHPLMSSRAHGSEQTLAQLACGPIRDRPGVRVLVGGLGLGYTLRAALDAVKPDASVVVVELAPAVVTWNRGPLGPLANHPLGDGRVSVIEGDVGDVIRGASAAFDTILLDVDNGPSPLTRSSNQWLYTSAGLSAARRALRSSGILAVWSAGPDVGYEARLRRAGFSVEVHTVFARGNVRRGSRHTLIVGRLTSPHPSGRRDHKSKL